MANPPFVIFVWTYALEGPALDGETFSTFALDNRPTIYAMSHADLVLAEAWRGPCGQWNVYPKLPGQGRRDRAPGFPVRIYE